MRTLQAQLSPRAVPATVLPGANGADHEGELTVHVDRLWRIRTGCCRVTRLDLENYTSQKQPGVDAFR
ncbi:hypothetical protein J1605_012141 [Eschrichtius robustus]|uniref:Uncharacterized protein n=1 Tax=Eschrichtius robustus TaxID=9764 RepID=A0AB34GJT4_ESCRO|nr:hypothetical protein J1605_012141 [Eschrichtius robustus]